MSIWRMATVLFLLQALAMPYLYAKDPKSTPIAEVGDTKITESEMTQAIGTDIYEAELRLYRLKKNWIDQKIRSVLFENEAKKAGLSLADWQRKEIDGKAGAASDQEVKSLVQQITRAPKGGGKPDAAHLAQAEAQAREALKRQSIARRANALYQELLKRQPVKILLNMPELPKIDVTFSRQDPSTGPENAPVTILAFTDFQCPYCVRGHATMREVEKAYPGKIRLVQRQYPSGSHPRARASAEAALCAGEQGQFWAYADKLFSNQQKLEDADLQQYAEELKLNTGDFGQCLSSHKYKAQIDRDLTDGNRYGIRGTPAFFVNGRFISGAQPFERFKEVVDGELAGVSGP
jgi:protein-disulfide isomerase